MNDYEDHKEQIFIKHWLSDAMSFVDPKIYTEPISRNISITPIQLACIDKWFDGMHHMLRRMSNAKKAEFSDQLLFDIILKKYDKEEDKINAFNILTKNGCNIKNMKRLENIISTGIMKEILEMSKEILRRKTIIHKLVEYYK